MALPGAPIDAATPPARTCWRRPLKALATGDPGAVSANRIAKEIGATWGAVKYQFGDNDGLWAAVLHCTAERRAEVLSPADTDGATAPARRRHHRHALRRIDVDRLSRDRESACGAAARSRRTGAALPAHRRRTLVLGTGLARDVPKRLCRPGRRPRPGAGGRDVHSRRHAGHHVRTPTGQLLRPRHGAARSDQRHRRLPRGQPGALARVEGPWIVTRRWIRLPSSPHRQSNRKPSRHQPPGALGLDLALGVRPPPLPPRSCLPEPSSWSPWSPSLPDLV